MPFLPQAIKQLVNDDSFALVVANIPLKGIKEQQKTPLVSIPLGVGALLVSFPGGVGGSFHELSRIHDNTQMPMQSTFIDGNEQELLFEDVNVKLFSYGTERLPVIQRTLPLRNFHCGENVSLKDVVIVTILGDAEIMHCPEGKGGDANNLRQQKPINPKALDKVRN